VNSLLGTMKGVSSVEPEELSNSEEDLVSHLAYWDAFLLLIMTHTKRVKKPMAMIPKPTQRKDIQAQKFP